MIQIYPPVIKYNILQTYIQPFFLLCLLFVLFVLFKKTVYNKKHPNFENYNRMSIPL